MKAKITCGVIMFFFFFIQLNAQSTVSYNYDKSGNRIKRTTIKIISANQNKSTDSTSQSENNQLTQQIDDSKKVQLYPNPTKGKIVIVITGYDNVTDLLANLYNTKGETLFTKKLVNGNNTLDISNFSNGTYLMRLSLGDKTSEWKIIKE